ncbi:MAG: hypothetical protein KKC20_25350 [Proteobacteria bacterium]|nr:hypothetical protein [Pseudomonadota bacterium]
MSLKIPKKDFKGLEKSKLDSKIITLIKYARIEARKIKNKLEPNQINSWLDLIEFLEKYAEEVREKARILKKRIEKGGI